MTTPTKSTNHALSAIPQGFAVVRRMGQATFLLWARLTGYWQRAERRVLRFWIVDRVEAWMRAGSPSGRPPIPNRK